MLIADVDETSLGLLPSEIDIVLITVSVLVTVSGPSYNKEATLGVDLSREYLIVQPGSEQVITTSTSFVKEPLSGVSTGGTALMMIGEARLATSLIVKSSLVATALISVRSQHLRQKCQNWESFSVVMLQSQNGSSLSPGCFQDWGK